MLALTELFKHYGRAAAFLLLMRIVLS